MMDNLNRHSVPDAVVGLAAEDDVEISLRDALMEADIRTVAVVIYLVIVLRCRVYLYTMSVKRVVIGRPILSLKPDGVCGPSVGRFILGQDII